MNCDRFHELLERWRAGELDPARVEALVAHRRDCPECQTVMDLLDEEASARRTRADRSLLDAVLHQTTGSTCSTVQDELGDWMDQACDRHRAQAIADHVDECPRCDELLRAMRRCEELLPGFAELDPGANFTADVMMATLASPSLSRVFLRRLQDAWQSLVLRPALPLEAGFVATLVLVLLTATPVAPWPQLPARALALVQGMGEQVREAEPASRAWWGLRQGRAAMARSAPSGLEDDGIGARWRRVSTELDGVAEGAEELGRALVSFDSQRWLPAAEHMGREARELWTALRGDEPPTTPDDSEVDPAHEETRP